MPQWSAGANCGRCALVRCVDPRCGKYANKDLKVFLTDQCPEASAPVITPVS